jgi:hypothetical protein
MGVKGFKLLEHVGIVEWMSDSETLHEMVRLILSSEIVECFDRILGFIAHVTDCLERT